MAAKKWYAWGTIYNGGESQKARDGRRLTISRNVTEPGQAVTQKSLGVSDEEWDNLVANGTVRPYKYPKCEPGESPADAVMRQLRGGREDISTDVLLGLALGHLPDEVEQEETEEDVEQLPLGV